MGSDQTPDTPAATESLRERMSQAAYGLGGFTQDEARMMMAILDVVIPIAEAELQKHVEEIRRLTPQCEGCVTGSDLGVPEYGSIAYEHPNCPIHGMRPQDYAAEIGRLNAQIQKHTEEKARLVGEFRRLAAEANKPDASRQPFDCGWDQAEEATWNRAAQMLEESKP